MWPQVSQRWFYLTFNWDWTPSSISENFMERFNAHLSYHCHLHWRWCTGKLSNINLLHLFYQDLMVAHNAIIANPVQKTFHANKKCCASDKYHVGDHVYLLTQNLTLPKGRVRKLVPKYIGPYKVVKAHNEASTVILELPLALIAQQISPTFHMGLIQKSIANNDKLFPKWDGNHSMILVKMMGRNGSLKRLHLTNGQTQKSLNSRWDGRQGTLPGSP